MKKFFSLTLCALLAALCVLPAAADVPYATATAGTAVVDGVIEEAWDVAETYTANALKDGTDEGITTEWKAMWDAKNLYLLIEVSGDKDHYTGSSQSWGDGVEVYYDIQNSDADNYETDDGIIQLGWNVADLTNTAYMGTEAGVAAAPGKYKIACTEKADGYIYEISFNLVDFCKSFTMSEGAVIGLEIQVNSKNAEGDGRTSAYGWADTDNTAWQYPYIMGDVELVPAPVVETVAEEVAVEEVAVAPQTFDMGVIAAVAAVVSAAGYAISKKR